MSARALALKILVQADPGKVYASDLLEEYLDDERISPLDRSLTTAMVYGTIRHKGTIDALLKEFSKIPLDQIESEMLWVLRTAVCQLVYMERIPAYAILDEAAELAKRHRNFRAAAFATGVLRAFQRALGPIEPDGPPRDAAPVVEAERLWPWTVLDALHQRWPDLPHRRLIPIPGGRRALLDRDLFPDPEHAPIDWLAAALSHPKWLVKRWLGRFGGAATLAALEAGNRHPELGARVNVKRATKEQLVERLRREKVEVDAGRMHLAHTGPIWRLGSFSEGWFTVQDDAAQEVAPLMEVVEGERVADLCAAPGGKASHLAELGAVVTAMDSERGKVKGMTKTFDRLRLGVASVVGDAKRPPFKPVLDGALVDVPCSNTGVLSRRVEARWRLRERDIRTLPPIQRSIFEAALALVRPGGRVVYSTCSLEPEENEELVRAVIRDGNGLKLEQELRIMPGADRTCGGYAARVRRMGR